MWDLRIVNPFGLSSRRNILFFVTTMLVAIFGYTFLSSPSAYAADATWNGGSIVYNGNQYIQVSDPKNATGAKIPGIHFATVDDKQNARVITFPESADLTAVSSASYSEYDFKPPVTFTNKSNTKTISIDPQSPVSDGVSSCENEGLAGVGWIICPTTNLLAGAMDGLYEILKGFLVVRPAQSNQENALYRAWTYMRNFANIAFVLGFMFIIYSQLTSFGLSNYNVKKILPRLIIAAILVNVSYWVCALAIDVSNILGYSLQDIFINMRNAAIGDEGNSWDVVSWKSLSGFILSGGTAAAAGSLGAYAFLAGGGTAIFGLLPILVGVLMAVLVALLIMAARQAIITVLVIIAPLAFVAYLLPNTEKYFDKWRGLFLTMLMIFPIFSVLFGGAQLAGIAIIQNADSINLVILGMAVQVAPLVITPFLIKFSGSLLGRIAGMVNNPNRGAVDRTRKWATERQAEALDRQVGTERPRGLAKIAQTKNMKRRDREGKQSASKAMADAIWSRDSRYADIQQTTLEASQLKDGGEAAAQKAFEDSRRTNPWIQTSYLETQEAKEDLAISKEKNTVVWENLKAGSTDGLVTAHSIAHSGLARRVRNSTEESQTVADQVSAAKGVQLFNYSEEMSANQALQKIAGGIDPKGAGRAQAKAVSVIEHAKDESVKNIKAASSIAPGDIASLKAAFDEAVIKDDAVAARAYVDLMAEANNPGIEALRSSLETNEGRMSNDFKKQLKFHVDAHNTINGSAEDIGTWSRDTRSITQISNDPATYANMSPAAFSRMKKSSQQKALDVNGISQETARGIMSGPAFQDLKPAIREEIKRLAS